MDISPAVIEIILFYHYDGSGKDYSNSQHFQEVSKKLVEKGMLKEVKDGRRKFEPNRDMIEVYVKNLCSQPFPVLKYAIPEKQ